MMPESLVNFTHLDYLSEDVVHDGEAYRIVHIYAEAPDYTRIADPEEGTACVDDASRAAIVYLRHFRATGDESSRAKAEALLRFIMYMQTEEGLFYNFVVNNRLEINRTHHRSRADGVEWWMARGIWALGTGVRILQKVNPSFAKACAERIRRSLPHLQKLLERYPETRDHRGRTIPTWLIGEDAADATSELMLGLVAFQQAQPDLEVQTVIMRFAEGLALMRYGSMSTFPYGLHASNRDGWHLWGNSQTQALAEAGIVTSAKLEADHFYPRLLVEGFLHSITFDDLHAIQYFERIAYGVRGVVVGLIRMFEATKDEVYAKMAGLAATWFTGSNAAGTAMYDPSTGRGYDGLHGDNQVNYNAGAESTIEALCAILEIERYPMSSCWLNAKGGKPTRIDRNGTEHLFRVFEDTTGASPRRIALAMNLTQETYELLEGEALDEFLS